MELKRSSNLIYKNLYVHKFIKNFLKKGKKATIYRIFFILFKQLKSKFSLEPLVLCLFILDEVKPVIELKSLRLGSMIYQIPFPLSITKQHTRSIKLISKCIAKQVSNKPLVDKIFNEFILILRKESSVLKQKQQAYREASTNRAFAHFR